MAAAAFPVLNQVGVIVAVYFVAVEIVPGGLVLFILRKLPRRSAAAVEQDDDPKSLALIEPT